jgi:hypothetical protein
MNVRWRGIARVRGLPKWAVRYISEARSPAGVPSNQFRAHVAANSVVNPSWTGTRALFYSVIGDTSGLKYEVLW